tara:strand:- start:1136 stop:1915 length:780 start_codon:yes stop_codon:yes gene_type:complete
MKTKKIIKRHEIAGTFRGCANFTGPLYERWRRARIAKLTQIVGGTGWFENKTVLELGAARGHIGNDISKLGANVVIAEGREENLRAATTKYPHLESYILNQETNWEEFFGDRVFDLIIHWGVLYHLENWEQDLKIALNCGRKICLESEVMDSDNPYLVGVRAEVGNDQSISGWGSYPSWATIERILSENDCDFTRYDDADLNCGPYIYDWEGVNQGFFAGMAGPNLPARADRLHANGSGGQRRFWMIENFHPRNIKEEK